MNTVKIFYVIFSEKNRAFLHDKLLIGTIFAERERERERDYDRYINLYRAFLCAYPKFFSDTFYRSNVFNHCCGFLFAIHYPAGFEKPGRIFMESSTDQNLPTDQDLPCFQNMAGHSHQKSLYKSV